jgi:uncharacterized protein (DUF3820 family)
MLLLCHMIKRKTVLVLGAGASMPFGFPSGQVLADIAKEQLFTREFRPSGTLGPGFPAEMNWTFGLIKDKFGKRAQDFGGQLLQADVFIDAFLEYQTGEFLEIGKAAIAAALLPCETQERLYDRFMYQRLKSWLGKKEQKDDKQNNWYQLLWSELDAPFDQFEENELSIVTFNYDRSLEHYLFTSLKSRYPGKTDEECADKISSIPIVHVHGKLGPLPWQVDRADIAKLSVPYNSMKAQPGIGELAPHANGSKRSFFDRARNSIKVIHESQESAELKQARELIANCDRLLFLGFGYHEENVKRLGIASLSRGPEQLKWIGGTTYGLQLKRKQNIHELVGPRSVNGLDLLIDKDIYTFLHDHLRLE